jgi:hypothetical protein
MADIGPVADVAVDPFAGPDVCPDVCPDVGPFELKMEQMKRTAKARRWIKKAYAAEKGTDVAYAQALLCVHNGHLCWVPDEMEKAWKSSAKWRFKRDMQRIEICRLEKHVADLQRILVNRLEQGAAGQEQAQADFQRVSIGRLEQSVADLEQAEADNTHG